LAIAVAGMAGSAMAQARSRSARSTVTRYCLPSPSLIARAGSSRLSQCRGQHQRQAGCHLQDGGKPADAQTAANELVSSENVAMLTGTFLSNIGLAVMTANQKESSSLRPNR
jgi:branched-chain amino acid transport system substrate-binding protein